MGTRGCLKCQALRHIATDCPNRKVITLTELQAVKEEEKDTKPEVELEED